MGFLQLTKDIGLIWLVKMWGGGGRAKSIMGIRNFNLRRSQLRKMGKVRSWVQMTLGKRA